MTDDIPPIRSSATRRLRRARTFRPMPIRSLIPNSMTVLALCAGLTAIRFGLEGRFEVAVAAIIVATILDGLDGRIARFLKGQTKFGAELDSIADAINFGAAPVILLYLWSLQQLGGLGWIAVLAFAVCCALRLARFNVRHEDPDRPAWTMNYFVGVPAPAGAGLVMLPLYLTFLGVPDLRHMPLLIAAHVFVIAFLMVSRVPTFSGKRPGFRIRRDMVLPILIGVGLFAAVLINYPWITFSILSGLYVASIPLAVWRYRRHEQRVAVQSAEAEKQSDPETG